MKRMRKEQRRLVPDKYICRICDKPINKHTNEDMDRCVNEHKLPTIIRQP